MQLYLLTPSMVLNAIAHPPPQPAKYTHALAAFAGPFFYPGPTAVGHDACVLYTCDDGDCEYVWTIMESNISDTRGLEGPFHGDPNWSAFELLFEFDLTLPDPPHTPTASLSAPAPTLRAHGGGEQAKEAQTALSRVPPPPSVLIPYFERAQRGEDVSALSVSELLAEGTTSRTHGDNPEPPPMPTPIRGYGHTVIPALVMEGARLSKHTWYEVATTQQVAVIVSGNGFKGRISHALLMRIGE